MISLLILAAAVLQAPTPVERLASDLFKVAVDERGDEAANAIGELGKDAIPTLTKAARSGTDSERAEAIWCFLRLADKSTGPLVFAMASSDPNRHIRSSARVALGAVASPEHIDALLGWAAEGDAYAVRGLGESGEKRAIPLLVSLIGKNFPGSHPDMWVSHDPDNASYPAAPALARLGEAGILALEKAFDQGSDAEWKQALSALPFDKRSEAFLLKYALDGGPKGEEALYRVSDVKSPELLKRMLAVLNADPTSRVGALYAERHKEWKAYLRAANRVLAAGGSVEHFVYFLTDEKVPGCAPFLLKALKGEVTEDVIRACEENQVHDALPLLVACVKTKKELSWEATRAIASFGVPGLRALDRLISEGSLAPDDTSEALFHVTDQASIPILRRYLSNTKNEHRLGSTIRVLGRLGDRASADEIVKLGTLMSGALGEDVTDYLVSIEDPRAHQWLAKHGHYFYDEKAAKPYTLDILAYALSKDIDLEHLDWTVNVLLPGKNQISPLLLRPLLSKDDGHKALALRLLREIGDANDAPAAKREIEGGNVWKRLEAWRTWKKLGQEP